MIQSPRADRCGELLERRLAYVEILKQQMLDLEDVRQKLAEAERALRWAKTRNPLHKLRQHAPETGRIAD